MIKYKYTATLRDGTTVQGSYIGTGESQAITVPGASANNPVIGLSVNHSENLSIQKLKQFGTYCFYCGNKLKAVTEYGGCKNLSAITVLLKQKYTNMMQ